MTTLIIYCFIFLGSIITCGIVATSFLSTKNKLDDPVLFDQLVRHNEAIKIATDDTAQMQQLCTDLRIKNKNLIEKNEMLQQLIHRYEATTAEVKARTLKIETRMENEQRIVAQIKKNQEAKVI